MLPVSPVDEGPLTRVALRADTGPQYKTFDFKDVIANLLGSSLALFAARHLDARARSSSTRRGADYEAIDTEAGP